MTSLSHMLRFLPNSHTQSKQNRCALVFHLPTVLTPTVYVKVAQQTAFRAAFLVDQAIQEKQVRSPFLSPKDRS